MAWAMITAQPSGPFGFSIYKKSLFLNQQAEFLGFALIFGPTAEFLGFALIFGPSGWIFWVLP
jgi:hypothetical protein